MYGGGKKPPAGGPPPVPPPPPSGGGKKKPKPFSSEELKEMAGKIKPPTDYEPVTEKEVRDLMIAGRSVDLSRSAPSKASRFGSGPRPAPITGLSTRLNPRWRRGDKERMWNWLSWSRAKYIADSLMDGIVPEDATRREIALVKGLLESGRSHDTMLLGRYDTLYRMGTVNPLLDFSPPGSEHAGEYKLYEPDKAKDPNPWMRLLSGNRYGTEASPYEVGRHEKSHAVTDTLTQKTLEKVDPLGALVRGLTHRGSTSELGYFLGEIVSRARESKDPTQSAGRVVDFLSSRASVESYIRHLDTFDINPELKRWAGRASELAIEGMERHKDPRDVLRYVLIQLDLERGGEIRQMAGNHVFEVLMRYLPAALFALMFAAYESQGQDYGID